MNEDGKLLVVLNRKYPMIGIHGVAYLNFLRIIDLNFLRIILFGIFLTVNYKIS